MFKPIVLYCLFISLAVTKCLAQTSDIQGIIASSSPTAASLTKNIDCPISFSSGLPEIAIPLYELKSTRINVPITLSYHSGGIKVTERTSTMGLGWTLNAGGAVTRVINGLPDDSQFGFLKVDYPANDTTVPDAYDQFCLANHLYNTFTSESNWDGQPDMFYYNYLGQGGKFIFKNHKAIGMPPEVMTLPFDPIKVESGLHNGTEPFIITGADGTKYEFQGSNAADYYYEANAPTERRYVYTAWYLTRIISADLTDTVQLNYFDGPPDIFSTYRRMTTLVVTHEQITNSPAGYGEYFYATLSREEHSARLKQIVSKTGKVNFNYASSGDPMLQSIDIYSTLNNTDTKIRTFNFSMSRFSGTTTSNTIRLDSLIETGYKNGIATNNKPYIFQYTSTDAPPFNTNQQDIWGYYNANGQEGNLLMETLVNLVPTADLTKRAANPDAMGKAMLQKIIYPTGGSTLYEYEPNQKDTLVPVLKPAPSHGTASIATINMYVGSGTNGIDVKFQPNSISTGTATLSFTASRNCTSSQSGCVYQQASVYLDDVTTGKNVYYRDFSDLDAGSVTSETYTATLTGIDKSHTYHLYFGSPGTITSSTQQTMFRMSSTFTDYGDPYTVNEQTAVYGGGMRIKRITQSDGTSHSLIKEYKYTIPYFNSSVFDGTLRGMAANMTAHTSIPQHNETFETYSEYPAITAGGFSNSSISYAEVEEVSKSTSGATTGKTVYTYPRVQDYIVPRLPYFKIDREAIRTQLTNQKIYKGNTDGSFTLLKEIQNTFNNINDLGAEGARPDSVKFFVATCTFDIRGWAAGGGSVTSSGLGGVPAMGCPIFDYTGINYFRLNDEYYNSLKTLLQSTTTSLYDETGSNPISSTINYTYANPQHWLVTRRTTVNSKQEAEAESIKYPLDYTYTSCNPASTCLANFTSQLNSLKYTKKVCEEVAIGNNSTGNFDNCVSTFNTNVAKAVSSYISCLPSETQVNLNCMNALPENDRAIALMQNRHIVTTPVYVGDTVSTRPVKQVTYLYKVNPSNSNAIGVSQVKQQLGTLPAETMLQYYTYDANGNALEAGKTTDSKIVYIWGYNNQYPVAKIVGSDYNTVIAYVNQSTLKNPTGDQQVRDEINKIRTALPHVQVTTFTYTPLLGLTSETSPTGLTTYYEYDAFQRLYLVRDKDGNILKQYDYQYQSPLNK